MADESKLSGFAKYAWFVLAWSLVVILWGVFLRASKSGDGCGQHWLTCQGEVVPSAPELKTIIEFSHRITSSLDGLLIIALFVWAIILWRRRRQPASKRVLTLAGLSFVFVCIEGLLGAGLVLTGNTAENLTPERPFWMAAHLVNTFILLALLSLTAWFASHDRRPDLSVPIKQRSVIATGAVLIFLVGISGSIAALSSMIFPSGTLAEGLAQDMSPTSHLLLRLRLLHPIISILTIVYLIFVAGWLRRESFGDPQAMKWSSVLSITAMLQLAFGAATLLTKAPILMQLGHLLLADIIWISFVLLSASFLSRNGRAMEQSA